MPIYKTAATPARAEPIPKVNTIALSTFMPTSCAALESSDVAIKAFPILVLVIKYWSATVKIAVITMVIREIKGISNEPNFTIWVLNKDWVDIAPAPKNNITMFCKNNETPIAVIKFEILGEFLRGL